MAKNSKKAECFKHFLDSMDRLYASVTSIMEVKNETFQADDWEKIARKIDKLSDEMDYISEKNASVEG